MQADNKTLEKGSIKKITITDGKVTNLDFRHNGQKYHAAISPQEIIINGVGKYQRDDNEFLWQTHHVCGASGFSPMLGDYCPSCSIKGGYTTTRYEARSFEPEDIPKALSEISSECNRLEVLLKENGFL